MSGPTGPLRLFEGRIILATTRIMSLHTGKGRTVGKAISDIIDYVGFTEKAEFGEYMQKYGMVCVKMLPYDEN